jgi:hypothetical protein
VVTVDGLLLPLLLLLLDEPEFELELLPESLLELSSDDVV